MENRRRLVRVEVNDFLELKPVNEVGKKLVAQSKDLTLMGVCFTSEAEWKKGQVLEINYFVPDELDSVQLKLVVVWSEFIGPEEGYFCGGEILYVEEGKEKVFASYYFNKLQERYFRNE
ncbi:MAG: hypothetical protein GF333_00395 [Candidatus Omnitrophica bacterium]|nr:hypothetical protein [Candidatus Omnitrophota bacterium]